MSKVTRITGKESMQEMILNMSENNIGCLTFLCQLLKEAKYGGALGGLGHLLTLDSIGLYGSQAYMLWNDCCDRDIEKVELVLRNCQMGKLSDNEILSNVSQGRGTPFKNLKSFKELGLTE